MVTSKKPAGFKPIHALMGENSDIAPILVRAKLISRLQQTFTETVPAHLRATSRVAAMEGSTLIIATANGAVAAMLKQMLPRLLVKFQENQKQEQEVTLIRVIVQPEALAGEMAPIRPNKHVESVTPMPETALTTLATQLSDSPLKETLKRIQQRRKRALTIKEKT
jgi:hypothetical protein